MLTLFLFDVDGVLINPKGYKTALRDTVNYFAAQMGQAPINLTSDEIAVFEACGLTNEWDSAAFCVGILLVSALNQHPVLQANDFNKTLENIRHRQLTIPRPDFVRFAHQVAAQNLNHDVPTHICHKLLADCAHTDVIILLDVLLGDIYSLNTPTTAIQQHYTLGSRTYSETYQLPALFETESYLIKYDTPAISPKNINTLLDWSKNPSQGFVIYTARPSLPANGASLGYAPEGDLAAELLGLKGQVPLIAAGRMEWLAGLYRRKVADYIKPSPVQALAAIGAAFAKDEISALHAAATLFEKGLLTPPLTDITENPTRIIVFEDSVGGIHATRAAVQRLQQFGAKIHFEAIGVSPEPSKQNALAKIADHTVPNVNEGLVIVFKS